MPQTTLKQLIQGKEDIDFKPKASNLNKRQLSALSGTRRIWLQIFKRFSFVLAFSILILVLFWPRLFHRDNESSQILIDHESLLKKEMLNPVYTGQDDHGQPYVFKADKAFLSNNPEEDDIILIDFPRGELQNQENAKTYISAKNGFYFIKKRFLKLKGNVHLKTDDGYDFQTESAIVDLRKSSVQGSETVVGKGPDGDIKAEGFRITEKGSKIVFIGGTHSHFSKK